MAKKTIVNPNKVGGGIFTIDVLNISNEINSREELRQALANEGEGKSKCLLVDTLNEAIISHRVFKLDFVYEINIISIFWSSTGIQVNHDLLEIDYNGDFIPGSEESESNTISFDEN